MRVTFIIPSLPLGGSERSLVKTIIALNSLIVRVDVIVFAKAEKALIAEFPSEVNIHVLGMSESANPLLWLKVRKLLGGIKPQIVIGWSTYANLVAIIATRFLSIRKVIVSERCYVPQIFSIGQVGKLKRKVILVLIKFLYKKAHLITANSLDNVRFLSKFIGRGPAYAQLPNAIDINQAHRLANMQPEAPIRTANGPHILALGRLHYQKGFDQLLQAFSLVRQQRAWNLTIVGDGPEKERLRELARSLGLEHSVQWIGAVKNPFPYYHWADIVVVPSRFEGFPNVPLEAMSCGRTVVCTDCPTGPKELTKNGLYGVLIKASSVSALAVSILKMGQDQKLRETFGHLAHEHILKNYDTKVVQPIYASILLNMQSELPEHLTEDSRRVAHANN